MKRFSAALALAFALASSACFAACPSPITGKDAGGINQSFNIYADVAGNCNTVAAPSTTINTLTGWTTATAVNTTQTLVANPHGAPAILVQLDQTSTITGGAVTYEGTFDGTNWVTIPVAQVLNPATFASLTNPYTLVATTNQPFLIFTQGYQSVRIRLSTVISGTATVTPFVALLSHNPILDAIYTAVSSALPAGTNNIGNVGGAIGSAVPSIGPYTAGQARSTEPAAATSGNLVGLNVGLEGKLITLPFANKENMVRGSALSAVNTAVTLLAAQGAGNKVYGWVQCGRTDAGTTAISVLFNDTLTTATGVTGTTIVLPNGGGGGGNNQSQPIPLVFPANTAATMTVSTATTNVICNLQGYFGT